MKRLILASMISLACTVSSYAQEKPQIQFDPLQKFHLVPAQPANPSVWGVVQGLDFPQGLPKQQPAAVIELKGSIPVQNGVCSVPLLEAHVDGHLDANDPGIAMRLGNRAAAPIPHARVPAPACQKK
jgi:hypothetical protein